MPDNVLVIFGGEVSDHKVTQYGVDNVGITPQIQGKLGRDVYAGYRLR